MKLAGSKPTRVENEERRKPGAHARFKHVPVIRETTPRFISKSSQFGKRAFDVLCAMTGIAVTAPLMLLIAAAIKLTSRGSVFYGQLRVGRDGKLFRIWKFRTMRGNAEEVLDEFLQQDSELKQQWETERKLNKDPRVVPGIGEFLRKSSLDELPQLWNVLKGEMSVVGPRPLPPYHLEQFDEAFCELRKQATPGITGPWQVGSRGDGRPEMFVKWDKHYIENWSLCMDLKILVRTFPAVLSGDKGSLRARRGLHLARGHEHRQRNATDPVTIECDP